MKALIKRTNLELSLVDFCIDGKDAIELVKKTYAEGKSYKLIILDFSMPLVGGLEASREIVSYLETQQLEIGQFPPVIFGLSANALHDSENVGHEAGMHQVFEKPLTFDLLESVLHDHYN